MIQSASNQFDRIDERNSILFKWIDFHIFRWDLFYCHVRLVDLKHIIRKKNSSTEMTCSNWTEAIFKYWLLYACFRWILNRNADFLILEHVNGFVTKWFRKILILDFEFFPLNFLYKSKMVLIWRLRCFNSMFSLKYRYCENIRKPQTKINEF